MNECKKRKSDFYHMIKFILNRKNRYATTLALNCCDMRKKHKEICGPFAIAVYISILVKDNIWET